MTDAVTARRELVAILRLAHAGELAAGIAYRSHARSLPPCEERRRIEQIEAEEWHHRALVGDMLRALGESPGRFRELRAWLIGRSLGVLCHLCGWLVPMYGAGHLESRNVRPYELAARHARDCGHPEWIDCLLTMATVEWEHEAFFRRCVQSHRVGRRLPLWAVPPPKPTIRNTFEAEGSEAESPEAESPEAESPEAESPEAGTPEAGTPEAGAFEAGTSEARTFEPRPPLAAPVMVAARGEGRAVNA